MLNSYSTLPTVILEPIITLSRLRFARKYLFVMGNTYNYIFYYARQLKKLKKI